MTRRRETTAAAVGMITLSVLLTWPLALRASDFLPSDLADPLLNAFSLAWDADRAAHGFAGLWSAPFYFPLRDTLAFSDHLLGIAVFTAPFQWLTGNAVLAYNLAFIGSYALAGFAAFLLARSVWQSSAAAWVAGVAFAAAPYRLMHISHVQMLTGGWLALALWGLHHYFTEGSRRGLVVCAAAYVLLAFSSSYLLYFGAVPVVFVAAAGLWRVAHEAPDGRGLLRRALVDLTATGLVVAAALIPVALAYLRVRGETGLRRSIAEMAMYSAHWPDFLSIPPGLRAWSTLLRVGVPERMLFPGLAVTVLAAVALLAQATGWKAAGRDRRATVWLCAAAFTACAWLAFGPAGGAYRGLVWVVPGLDGLRVPARMMIVASLPLALLAGRGVQVLSGRRGLVVSILAATAIAVEGLGVPLPLAPFDAFQRGRAPLNVWLRHSLPGGLLELPIAGPQYQPFTTRYQFNTLFHRHPVVNGYSGTGYALQDYLASPGSPVARVIDVPAALQGLRSIGVRYIVLHRGEYQRWTGWPTAPLVEALDAESAQYEGRYEFGDALAWQLADAPPPANPDLHRLAPLPPTAFTASASHGSDSAHLAFDGRRETRWTTGKPQQGDEWFEVTFERETDVAALVFRASRTGQSERPHHLVVESVADGGAARPVFDGSLVPSMIASSAGVVPETVISLPPNRSRILRLRQTGRGGRLSWSIYELQIYVR